MTNNKTKIYYAQFARITNFHNSVYGKQIKNIWFWASPSKFTTGNGGLPILKDPLTGEASCSMLGL